MARPPCRSLGQGWLIASREGLTLIGLLHPRRPGKHGAAVCTLQVQEQDLDHAMENADRRTQEQKQQEHEHEQEQEQEQEYEQGQEQEQEQWNHRRLLKS